MKRSARTDQLQEVREELRTNDQGQEDRLHTHYQGYEVRRLVTLLRRGGGRDSPCDHAILILYAGGHPATGYHQQWEHYH